MTLTAPSTLLFDPEQTRALPPDGERGAATGAERGVVDVRIPTGTAPPALLAAWGLTLRLHNEQRMPYIGVLSTRHRADEDFSQGFLLSLAALRDLSFDGLVTGLSNGGDGSGWRTATVPEDFRVRTTFQVEGEGDWHGLQDWALPQRWNPTGCDLRLIMRVRDAAVTGALEYNTGLYLPATIERMARHVTTVLKHGLTSSGSAARHLPALADEEALLLTGPWGRGSTTAPATDCLHELVETQADRVPSAVAVTDGHSSLTYAALDSRANALAHVLRQRGVGPETRVGVLLGRRLELVTTVLAVLKAGAAYVPLDDTYPADHIRRVLQIAGTNVVVTDASVTPAVREVLGASVVDLSADAAEIAVQPATRPVRTAQGHNLAYCIFTSGSTGVPKGSMTEHRNIVNYLRWATDVLPRGAAASTVAHSPVGFDFTIPAMFVPLVRGDRLDLAPDGLQLDELMQLVTDPARSFDFIRFTPSHLEVLARHLTLSRVRISSDVLFVGGEALPGATVAALLSHQPGLRILSQYGATEVTVGGCHLWISDATRPEVQTVAALGRPNPNIQVYVVDDDCQLVPPGVNGQIAFGGAGIGRGYSGAPGRTAGAFVPDPFADVPGSRLYLTGDRGRYNENGVLRIAGRLDRQVKIRGHRVEPGDVEAFFTTLPGVTRAAAVVTASSPRKLVVFVEVSSLAGVTPDVHELRQQAAQVLPAHLVPSEVVVVRAFPLTHNGKIDVSALRSEHATPPAADSATTGQSLRIFLADLWSEALDGRRPADDEDFLAFGGDSLAAMRVVQAVQERLGVQITLTQMFEASTVAGMARLLEERTSVGGRRYPSRVRRVGSGNVLPAQRRLWFMHELLPAEPVYNVALAVEIQGLIDVEALDAALQRTVAAHPALRTTFDAPDGAPRRLVHDAMRVSLGVSSSDNDTVVQELTRFVRQPFDLGTGPLLRAALVRTGVDRHILGLCLHHIVCDDWSIQILIEDLVAGYASIVRNRPDVSAGARPPAAEPSPAHSEPEVRGDVLADQLRFWREELSGLVPFELPTDRPRRAERSLGGTRVSRMVSTPTVRAVTELATRLGATPFMALTAVLQALLVRYTGRGDAAVAVPVARRHLPGAERIVGFLVNMLVLRAAADGRTVLSDLIERGRDRTLLAFANADVPFERVVEELRPTRDKSRLPFTQVAFALQTHAPRLPAFEGTSIRPVEVHTGTSKYDLLLEIIPTGTAEWILRAEYTSALFAEPTIVRLLSDFVRALDDVTTRPDVRVSDLVVSAFVGPVGDLPKATNGTDNPVDVAVLPASDDDFGMDAYPAVVVSVVLSSWSEVLKVDLPRLQDDFFDQGGHSVLAAALVSRINRQLDIRLPLLAIFDTPTVRELIVAASALRERQ